MKVETIAEQLLFTTVKIETVHPNATGFGTGFFFIHEHQGGEYPFIVTNKHVIKGAVGGKLIFTQKGADGEPLIGQRVTLNMKQEVWEESWFGHPDPAIDIAVMALEPLIQQVSEMFPVGIFYIGLNVGMMPTAEQLSQLDVLEQVAFVGYPNGVWDSKNLIPIMRRGTTATPLTLDFEGEPKFLIDASVFGGSSGSPVFILDNGLVTDRNGTTSMRSRIHFIGVIAQVYHRTDLNAVIAIPIPTQYQPGVETKQMIDLGIVIKARTVVEAIMAYLAIHAEPE